VKCRCGSGMRCYENFRDGNVYFCIAGCGWLFRTIPKKKGMWWRSQ